MTTLDTAPREEAPTLGPTTTGYDGVRLSTRFGIAFSAVQLGTMILMAIFVLPHAGSPGDPALERGHRVLDAADVYRAGNYLFMISGVVLLGFLGAVNARLRQVDRSGALASVALAAGAMLAVIWPLAGVFHDVAIDTAEAGTDLRILAGWDAVAPYSLAFSALPRLFFVGALVLGLRATGTAPWLQRIGVVILVVSAVGSATLLAGGLFPVLALSTLAYEVWIGAVAWHWLKQDRARA